MRRVAPPSSHVMVVEGGTYTAADEPASNALQTWQMPVRVGARRFLGRVLNRPGPRRSQRGRHTEDFNVTESPSDRAYDEADAVELSDSEVSLLRLVSVNFDSHGRMHLTNWLFIASVLTKVPDDAATERPDTTEIALVHAVAHDPDDDKDEVSFYVKRNE